MLVFRSITNKITIESITIALTRIVHRRSTTFNSKLVEHFLEILLITLK